MKRAFNFSPGPATLPLEVLREVQDEFLDYQQTGTSIIEQSHRAKPYGAIHEGTIDLLKELLEVKEDFEVAFFGGGASTQFPLVAMNWLSQDKTADYLITGAWSEKAAQEASLFGRVHPAYRPSEAPGKYTKVPSSGDCSFSADPVYVHLTSNNTIFGTQFSVYPESPAPIIADMSSDFLSAPVDTTSVGMIYAGAQKNLGPAGVTVVVIHKEMLEKCNPGLPSMFDYRFQISKRSLFNTPAVFPIYLVHKVLKWIKSKGGLVAMAERNREKAKLLYDAIDQDPGFYLCPVEKESRSKMNVVFRLPTADLERAFIEQAADQNMISLKGHRSVGGIRASIYNAVDLSWIQNLVSFMSDFKSRHG